MILDCRVSHAHFKGITNLLANLSHSGLCNDIESHVCQIKENKQHTLVLESIVRPVLHLLEC